MSPRQIRRASERKLRKLERKINRSGATTPVSRPTVEAPLDSPEPFIPPSPLTPNRTAANRANAQLSTGPKTPAGKAISSLNAVKTGLTGRTVLLPTDHAALYEHHVRSFMHELRPATPREHALAQSLADTAWRLERIPALELALYAQGRLEFAETFNEHDAALRPGLIELHTYLAYEKQLRNLHLQEMRLRRQREKDTAELRQLQQERTQRRRQNLETAAKLYTAAQHDGTQFDPADFGFDFSLRDVEDFLEGVRAANLLNATLKSEYQRAKSQAQAA